MITVQNPEIESAKEHWQAGRDLEAGRILFENVPPALRPMWAGRILEAVASRCEVSLPEIERILQIAPYPRKWHDGHCAFDALREQTLILDKLTAKTSEQRLLHKTVLLAELVAKVTYNATNPDDEFDEDAGWWIARLVKGILETLHDDEFSEAIWPMLCNEIEQ